MIPLIVAILAPIFSSIQLIPQLWKTYKTKSVKDLSCHSLLLFLMTDLVWFIHGYYIFDFSLLASALISIFVNVLLLGLYLVYHKKRRFVRKMYWFL